MEVAEAQPQATKLGNETVKITVCLSLSGIAEGGQKVYDEIEKQIGEMKSDTELAEKKECHLGQVGCRGDCSRDVLVDVYVPGEPRITYEKVKPEMVSKILKDHIIDGKVFKKAAPEEDYYEQLNKQNVIKRNL